MISVDLVIDIHHEILQNEPGLKGLPDRGKLESAIARIDNWRQYKNTDNIFDIAALYAVSIAKAHAFPDGNKRTAMVTMLTYLNLQGIDILANHGLDDLMVDVASGKIDIDQLSHRLQTLIEFS